MTLPIPFPHRPLALYGPDFAADLRAPRSERD